MKSKLVMFLLVFVPVMLLDQLSKVLAVAYLRGQEALTYFGGFFRLTYHENTGAMLSLGGQLPDWLRFVIFTLLVALALLAFMIYLFKKPMHPVYFISGQLMLSGGLGNLYDRAFNDGRVVDFMVIQLGPLKTGVFNVADVAIMAAFFAYLFLMTKWGQKYQLPSEQQAKL